MKLGQYIGELLYDHDCVIITDFGGFVANYRSATIHPVQHTFSPPAKSIAFNQNLVNNDGLLANFISNKLLLSYPDACRVINDFVIACNAELERGNKIVIENIGELFYDYERNLQFVPAEHKNYLLDSFGLGDIQSPAIKRNGDFDLFTSQQDAKIIPAEKRKNYLKPVLRIAAITGVAAMLTFAYFNPIISGKISKSLAGMFPAIEAESNSSAKEDMHASESKTFKEAVAVTETQPVEDIYQKSTEEKTIEVAAENTTPAVAEEVKPDVAPVPSVQKIVKAEVHTVVDETKSHKLATTEGNFHIIGGCFSVPENAAKLTGELQAKGFPAKTLGKGKRGLEMVSISSATTLNRAEEMLAQVKESGYPDAWIMRR